MSNESTGTTSWLHLSDLHVFIEADTTFIINDFKKLADKISPQFIVVTGDFRSLNAGTTYDNALKYLEEIIQIFKIRKEDVFLVPGNHDVSSYYGRKKAINEIVKNTPKKYNYYQSYISDTNKKTLLTGFNDYIDFVRCFYKGSKVEDERLSDPSGVFCINWEDKINIFHINTALISDGMTDNAGNRLHDEIIDIDKIADIASNKLNQSYPSIMLGHHGLSSLCSCHKDRLERVLRDNKFSAYLHGDIHVYNNRLIEHSTPNSSFPEIACGKSAPQAGDTYSEYGVIFYSWKGDSTYVYPYQWTKRGFIEVRLPEFTYEINEPYKFKMQYASSKNLQTLQTTSNFCSFENNLVETYLNEIEKNNCYYVRRDSVNSSTIELQSMYTFPSFSCNILTPILSDSEKFHVVITSDSGCGKSLLLQCLALVNSVFLSYEKDKINDNYKQLFNRFQINDPFFPVIIRAKDFNLNSYPSTANGVVQNPELLDYASYSTLDKYPKKSIDRELLCKMCKSGNALILIDSFDEVHEDKASAFLSLIYNFITNYPDTSIILTSRYTAGLRDLQQKGFTWLQLNAFSEDQIKDQIRKHVKNYADSLRISTQIFRNHYLYEMSHNPLMLSEIIYKMLNSPSANVIEILEAITNAIIQQRWGDFEEINDETLKNILACISWRMLVEEDLTIDKSNISEIFISAYKKLSEIRSSSQEYEKCLSEKPFSTNDNLIIEKLNELSKSMSCRSGILNLDDQGQKYVFQDKIMQYYLAAIYLKQVLGKYLSNRVDTDAEIFYTILKNAGMSKMTPGFITTMAMAFSLLSVQQQKGLFAYLIFRGSFSTNKDELILLAEGLFDLLNKKLGNNIIGNTTSHRENDCKIIAEKWLATNIGHFPHLMSMLTKENQSSLKLLDDCEII